MYLILFLIFLALSLVLILIGFWKPEHTEFTLIGFAFLFTLSFVFTSGDVQYQIGHNETLTYTNVSGEIVPTTVERVEVYDTFQSGGLLSQFVGYWLAVLSVVGFTIVLVSARRPEWFKRGGE